MAECQRVIRERLQKVMEDMMKLGFIGCGKMASAIIGGCLASGEFEKENVFASEINESPRNIAKEKFGINIYDNNIDVVKSAEVIANPHPEILKFIHLDKEEI